MLLEPTAVCAVGFLASGVVGLAGGAGDQLAGFGVGVGGEGLDGDLVAEALEAADVVACAAPGAIALLVVVGAEVVVPGAGVGQQAWMMTSWTLPMATWAFFFGSGVLSRRYLAPRKVWVRPAPAAASPRAAPR